MVAMNLFEAIVSCTRRVGPEMTQFSEIS